MFRLLILDDEKNERDCLRFLIEKAKLPFEMRDVDNAFTALDILRSWKADIILTDIQMPAMNGLDFIKQVSQLYPDTKLIIFSNYAEFEYARAALHYGVENYILKPVIPTELENTLNAVIEQITEERTATQRLQASMLQSAIQLAVFGNLEEGSFSEEILEQLRHFDRMVLLDLPNSFLENNYAQLYEGLRSRLHLNFASLNLTPQALLLIQDEIYDEKSFGTQIISHIQANYGISCYLAISRPMKYYSSLKEAYAYVEQRMEQRFWNPSEQIFTYQNGDSETMITEDTDDNTLLALIKNALSARDEAKFTQGMDLFLKRYRRQSNQSQIYVKFVFSNLVASLYPFLPDSVKRSGPSMETIISDLYLQRDISKIIDMVQKMAEPISQSFGDSNQNIRRELVIVQNYIHEHYSQELSVELLASIVFLSPDYLSRLFKKATGKSLYQYIRQFRMEKASELLRNTTKKVIDIGIEIGYPNYSYFCQSFREYFGKSPDKYRQEGKNA